MKQSYLIPILSFWLFVNYSASNRQKQDELKLNNKFIKVYSMNYKNRLIGDVFVKFVNDSVFTDLCVVKEQDTIYTINKDVFNNKKGRDIVVYNKGFWGYMFVLRNNDHFTLSYYRNNGMNISDDITIEWNYDKNVLEVRKLP